MVKLNRIPYDMIEERGTGKKLDEKLNEVNTQLADIAYNVKSFGAKGDGVTNDTTAIQNAVNSLNGKGTVYFPKGTYNISSPIVLPSGSKIILKGNGFGTIINATANMTAMIIKSQGWVDGGSIQSIFLECNRKATNGINVEQGSRFTIEKVTVQNYLDVGIQLKNTNGLTGAVIYGTRIEDCVINGLMDGFTGATAADRPNLGVLIDSMSPDNWVKGCIITNTKSSFVKVLGGNANIVHNHLYSYPELEYNPDYFIDVWANTTSIKDNFMDGPETGIRLGGLDCTVEDNTFFWNSAYNYDKSASVGVLVDFNTTGAIITGNRFSAYGNAAGYDIKTAFATENRNLIANNVSNSLITNKYKQVIGYDMTGSALIGLALKIQGSNLTLDQGGASLRMRTPDGANLRSLALDNSGALTGLVIQSGTTANRPSGAWQGHVYFDTTLNKLIIKGATVWVDVNGTAV